MRETPINFEGGPVIVLANDGTVIVSAPDPLDTARMAAKYQRQLEIGGGDD